MRQRRVETPDFCIEIEWQDGVRLAHCSVSRWTVRIAREAREGMDEAMRRVGGPVYAAAAHPHGGDFVKLDKFCRWMGFEFWDVVRVGAVRHPVWVRWS